MQKVRIELGGESFSFGPHFDADMKPIQQRYPKPAEAVWRHMYLSTSRAEPDLSFDSVEKSA